MRPWRSGPRSREMPDCSNGRLQDWLGQSRASCGLQVEMGRTQFGKSDRIHRSLALAPSRQSVFFVFAIGAFTEHDEHTRTILTTSIASIMTLCPSLGVPCVHRLCDNLPAPRQADAVHFSRPRAHRCFRGSGRVVLFGLSQARNSCMLYRSWKRRAA